MAHTKLLDLFGQEVEIGDFVLGSNGHQLACYTVVRKTPKMVCIVKIGAKTSKAQKGTLRYADELFKIDSQMVTFYLMKNVSQTNKKK